MAYALVIEITARDEFDAETAEYHDKLTPEQRSELINDMKAEVRQLIAREMDATAKIDVSVRIEETKGAE